MKTNGTNGSNGNAQSNPQIAELLAQLAAVLQAPQVAPAPQPAPAPKARKPRAPKAAAEPVRAVPVGPDHRHTTYTILEAAIPLAEHTRSGRAGAGLIVRVACACGCIGTLEIPAQDAEVMAQSASWQDGEA